MIEKVKLIINWTSKEDDEINQYSLRIYWRTLVEAVVVVSNITNFPGRKIGDITPQIIDFVNNIFDISTDKVMLVEHYPISSLHEDIYFHVLYVNNEPIKYEINKNELIGLIGKSM